MRLIIGCSIAIAAIAFVIGFLVSLFISGITWTDRLQIALLPAVMAFVAAFLLASHDSAKQSGARASARKKLLASDEVSAEDFVAFRPFEDIPILLETRNTIARFYDVPEKLVGRDLRLVQDLLIDELEPGFHFFVVNSVIASQETKPIPFVFSMAGIETIDDLASAIRKVIDGFEQGS